ncbi:MAG: uracil-DNA glycosylase family protein [Gammaproteobacteria bacterium]|nr:uracil-DNA glycosylase family protein [Gammaproteobacteria bacterium]
MPLSQLLNEIEGCTLCAGQLPHEPRPVVRAAESARIMIIGQAPGRRVHETGIPWNDPSGKRLREWLQVDDETFYDPEKIAIMPMGFCFPGTGKSGDLPPRPECAPAWHQRLWNELPNIQLTLLIGQYAQNQYLPNKPKTLTETVQRWQDWAPEYFALPHPSPRNQIWLKKNAWFGESVIPALRQRVHDLLT